MKKACMSLLAAGLVIASSGAFAQQAAADKGAAPAPVDRAKILTAVGVFGNFSTYKLRPDYYLSLIHI